MKKFHRTNALSGDTIDHDVAARWLVNSVVINRDLSMGCGWRVSFPYLPTLSDPIKNDLHQNFRAMLHAIPDDMDMQVIFDQHHNSEAIGKRIREGLEKVDQPVVRAIIEEKARLTEQGFVSERLRFLEGYVILVRKNTIPSSMLQNRYVDAVEPQRAKGFMAKASEMARRLYAKVRAAITPPAQGFQFMVNEYEAGRRQLMEVGDAVHGSLVEMGLKPEFLSNQDILDLFYRHWNPHSFDQGSRARVFRPGEMLPMTDYYLRSPWSLVESDGTSIKDGMFKTDDQYHLILTIRTPPETMTFTQWDGLMLASGQTRLRIYANVQHGSIAQRKKRLKKQLPLLRAQVEKNPDFAIALQDVEAELVDLGREAEKVWLATHFIHVWGDSVDQVKKSIQAIKAYGEKMDGLLLVEETHASWEYWRACQPFWTRDTDRYREHSYSSTQLVTQLPMGGQANGLDGPTGAIFETTAGSVYNLIFHGRQFSNYNVLVMGGSGTGKSFMVSDILAQMSRHNPSVVIVDLGGSFRSMCLAQGGQYIDMDLKNPQNRINPLYLPPNVELDEEMLSTMVAFVERLIVDAAIEKRLKKEQVTIVEQALTQTFQRAEGREIFLHNLKESLGSFSDGAALAARLSPWTGTGRYAKLFDGPSLLSANGRFTVFDLSKVVDNPDLCSVMFSTIIQQVSVLGSQNPSQMKFLVFDEAWKMLEDEVVASFLVAAFRTLRKVGFSVIGISQGIEEFAKTKNKSAITNNLAHYIILRQNSEAAAQMIADEFKLNSSESAIITRLQSRPGYFSQALVVQKMEDGRNRSVLTINRPSPLNYWCCTNNPQDRGAIEAYKAKGLSHLEALVQLAKDYPNGAPVQRAA